MATKDVWTIGDLLEWTACYLKDHGADSPRLDAEVLLAHVLGCRRIELYTQYAEVPGEAARKRFRELVRERSQGMPVAYLVGQREFYSLPFRVTRDVLIPRPETEFLVVRLLDLAAAREHAGGPLRIADVGTGSGILAICAAKNLPDARVTAIDLSAAALDVARANAADHGVAERIELIESDLFAAVDPAARFDFVLSNPPYIATHEMDVLARDVRQYEPRSALEAGPQGTEVIERLIHEAAERMVAGGWLLTEISPMIETAVRRLVESHGGYELHATVKDSAGHARVIQARRK